MIITVAGGGGMGGTAAGRADGTGSAAARFNGPGSLSFDAQTGSLYVADSGSNIIRRITIVTNIVSTIAGGGVIGGSLAGSSDGVGAVARFRRPLGLTAVPLQGSIFVADTDNCLIRAVALPSSLVTTIAGNGGQGIANGIGSNAQFNQPHGVVIGNSSGILYITDWGGASGTTIRKIVIATRVVSALVGSSFGRADGVGSSALFFYVSGMGLDIAGANLYVSEYGNNLIRKISIENKSSPRLQGAAASPQVAPRVAFLTASAPRRSSVIPVAWLWTIWGELR